MVRLTDEAKAEMFRNAKSQTAVPASFPTTDRVSEGSTTIDPSLLHAKSVCGLGTALRLVTNSIFNEFINQVGVFDHRPGKFGGGAKTMSESSPVFCAAKLGKRSVEHVTVTGPQIFDTKAAATRRKARSCEELHPGLCRVAHAGLLQRAKRIGKAIYNTAGRMQPNVGHGLYCLTAYLSQPAQYTPIGTRQVVSSFVLCFFLVFSSRLLVSPMDTVRPQCADESMPSLELQRIPLAYLELGIYRLAAHRVFWFMWQTHWKGNPKHAFFTLANPQSRCFNDDGCFN